MSVTYRLRRLGLLSLLLGAGFLLSGCAATVVTTAVSAVGVKAWESRSTEDQITDSKIHTGILQRLQDQDSSLVLDVSTDVWEQRVMISGTVDQATQRALAAGLARKDKRIRTFYNHVRVVPTSVRNRRREQSKAGAAADSAGQALSDVWIETKIKGKLLTASGVKSVNFFWRSVMGDVYIIGRARTGDERDRVLSILRDTDGVKRVTQHIAVGQR